MRAVFLLPHTKHIYSFPRVSGDECRNIGDCNRPMGLSYVGERWSADECGSGVHVVQGSFWRGLGSCDRVFRKSGGLQGSSPTSLCALSLHVCRRVEGGVFQILCMHLVVVSEREISDVVL